MTFLFSCKIRILPLDKYNTSSYTIIVIKTFADKATQDLFDGVNSREARKIPISIWNVAKRKLDHVNYAGNIRDLAVIQGNRLEKLSGKLADFHSIRINDQFRIIFKWSNGQADHVAITDYH